MAFSVGNVHRDDHYAACFHLFDQNLRDDRCARRDDDPVERRIGGQPLEAIAEKSFHAERQLRENIFGLEIQVSLTFDAEDFRAHGGQNAGLVARPCAYFEHFHSSFNLQELGLEGHRMRLRDGLPCSDGESLVLIGLLYEGRVKKHMARHLVDGGQNRLIGDAFGAQLIHELLAEAFGAVIVLQVMVHYLHLRREITGFSDATKGEKDYFCANFSIMLKIGVLGAGHLGKIHLNCIRQIGEYELVGFYDPDGAIVQQVETEMGIRHFDSIDALIDAVDVVDIVTPTISHFECASRVLKKRKHVFIEKPIVATPGEANALKVLADEANVKVQVGHVERFNPAFIAAEPFIGGPLFIEAHRLAQFNPRGTDVPVVLDLMVHDLDILLSVVKSPVSHVSASGVSVVSPTPDITNARIEFENGAVANLTASRLSMKNMRKTRIFQNDAYIAVDFLDKKAEIVRIHDEVDESNPLSTTITLANGSEKQITFEMPEVRPINAIQTELECFYEAIMHNTTPVVSIDDGINVLKLAYRILDAVDESSAKVKK